MLVSKKCQMIFKAILLVVKAVRFKIQSSIPFNNLEILLLVSYKESKFGEIYSNWRYTWKIS